MVKLEKITPENLDSVPSLQIHDHQSGYVSNPAVSLAQAYIYRDTAYPFAICADDKIVGFIMLGYHAARKQYTLWKLMIDKKFQRKGYGREALRLGIAFLAEKYGANEVCTGVVLVNKAAKKLYESVGFRETVLSRTA